MEKLENQAVALVSECRVVAGAFIAHESMRAIDLVPGKTRTNFLETRFDQIAAFERDVGILASPDVQQFSLDFAGAFERVDLHSRAEAALVNVSGIEADRRQDVRVHRGAEGQVSTDADSHDT